MVAYKLWTDKALVSGRVEAHLRGIRGCQACCRMACLRELIVDRLESTPKAVEYAIERTICLVKDCTMYAATRHIACYPLVGPSKGEEGHCLVKQCFCDMTTLRRPRSWEVCRGGSVGSRTIGIHNTMSQRSTRSRSES